MRYSKPAQVPITPFANTNGRPPKIQPIDNEPPPPDESYWASLLGEIEKPTDHVPPVAHAEKPIVSDDDWRLAEQMKTADTVLNLTIAGANRGGLLIVWNTLHGFVPASQLLDSPTTGDSQARRTQLVARIGQTISLRIIELDRAQNRLILSERAAQVQPGTRAIVLDRLNRGDVVSGRVTNVCDFGTFVDLGGLEGLIHISELSWGRVGHPADLLRAGDMVRVRVLEIDREQARVALSLKRMLADPWLSVESHYRVGQVVSGRVTSVVEFGAFVSLEEGLEGLIHISELAEGSFMHPRNILHEGEWIQARVLNIDSQGRRLGLSLRGPIDTSD